MRKTYEVAERVNKQVVAEFLRREGQFLMPMELVERTELAVDEVIEVMGRALPMPVPVDRRRVRRPPLRLPPAQQLVDLPLQELLKELLDARAGVRPQLFPHHA